MIQPNPIRRLLTAARRRHLGNLLFEQGALAVTLGTAGVIVLLVLGTQILDWYWPVLLFAASLAAGIYRARKKFCVSYRLLQQVDRRLELRDSLSTAYYFENPANAGRGARSVRQAQHEEAERLSDGIRPRQAVPFSMPASAYAAIITLVVAGSLFAVRYGVRRSLDLRPPISEALVEFFRPSPEMAKAWADADEPPGPPESAASRQARREGKFNPDADAELSPVEAPGDALAPDANQSPSSGERQAGEHDGSASDGPRAGEPSQSPPDANAGQAPPPGGQQPPKFPQPEESDLLRKMEDAFAKLLAKLKIKPEGGERQRAVPSRNPASRQDARRMRSQEAGSPQGEGMPASLRQGDPSRQGAQQMSAAQGRGQGQPSDQPGQENAQSGAGKKQGSKDIQLARQLEAMGKLTEILGKRAEKIKGDVMVEVSSGNQRLRTAYTDTDAAHRAAGGEIHRDEVPLALRHYVQKYFEEVRKQNPSPEG